MNEMLTALLKLKTRDLYRLSAAIDGEFQRRAEATGLRTAPDVEELRAIEREAQQPQPVLPLPDTAPVEPKRPRRVA